MREPVLRNPRWCDSAIVARGLFVQPASRCPVTRSAASRQALWVMAHIAADQIDRSTNRES